MKKDPFWCYELCTKMRQFKNIKKENNQENNHESNCEKGAILML